jgi:hypothetical protein
LDLIAYWNRLAEEERGDGKKGAEDGGGGGGGGGGAKKEGRTARRGSNGEDGDTTELERFLQFKTRLFFDMLPSDVSAIEMAYIQACHDVVGSRYPCNEQDAITLAALQVQEEYGDHPGVGQATTDNDTPNGGGGTECKYLKGKLHKYLNARTLEVQDPDELEQSVLRLYAKLHGYTQAEARLSYLDFVRAWKIYGST